MANSSSGESPRRIKSIKTANRLLMTIQELSEPNLSNICAEMDKSKGTICTYLQTLKEEGFVHQSGGQYNLGMDFLIRGEKVRNSIGLYREGLEVADDLAERTGEWVHLTVEHRGQELTIYETGGEEAIAMDYHVQMREVLQYLHSTAAGKAMLAHRDESYVNDVIEEHGLVQRTDQTITDREELFEELARIREQGYAVNDEEEIRGMRAVGAPVQGVDGEVCGAISLTAPPSRLSGETFEVEMPKLVIEASNIIEINLETARNP